MNAEDSGSSLIVSRARFGWRDLARSYDAVVDNIHIARIRRGERIEVPISPGRHKIFMSINWGSSDPIELEVRPGESAQLFCKTGHSQIGDGYIDLMYEVP